MMAANLVATLASQRTTASYDWNWRAAVCWRHSAWIRYLRTLLRQSRSFRFLDTFSNFDEVNRRPRSAPITGLMVSIAQAMGLNIDSDGDAKNKGTLPGVLA